MNLAGSEGIIKHAHVHLHAHTYIHTYIHNVCRQKSVTSAVNDAKQQAVARDKKLSSSTSTDKVRLGCLACRAAK